MSVREQLEAEIVELPGIHRHRSRWGHEYAYSVGGTEIAHFHGDGRLDVRLTRERIQELKLEGAFDERVKTRGPSAQWITVRLSGPKDRAYALRMVEEAIRANA